MRIGIDTNIWISKFFFDSNTFKAVFDIVNKHILIMPENVLDEILTKTFTGTKKFLFGSKNHKLGKKDNKRLLKIEHVRAIYDDCMSFKPNVKLYDKN
ncbi:hypothetical protein FACS189459_0490 [Bacilli bacterium]|nr:hypothetical protein FACS189459_0490 [Bacilli bacterium]